MICEDCLEEVDKLTRSGVCKKCYSRIQNMKYNNKPYVPLKDLPDEERERLLELRKQKTREGLERKERNKKRKEKVKDNNTITEKNAEEQYQNFVNTIAKGDLKLYQQILQLLNINEQEIREEVDRDIEKNMIEEKYH